MEPAESKQELRRAAIARRKLVAAEERTRAGAQIANHLHELPLPEHGGMVAAYVSVGSETETRPLLAALLRESYRVLVPRLGGGMDVGWGELRGADMALADCGERRLQEPAGDVLSPEILQRARMIILPALMVDECGTRLGRGGGWYDRALMHRAANAPVIAVCWPWEISPAPLPHETHDLPVDGVLSPEGYRPLKRATPPARDCQAND
ncbi:5-formyltetrahydrofolate cyclo-ligase [Bifidobacterium panos]|uniref:5-formyltetrahydrofolate cyclo-ligase n=1 Tax=Bifidobacterium panos TaxID=2675321 RepID=A0ABX1SW63_9BIFI|nr:5-formyltetrahydrofolate cyclo-ligase [Bifidobacterium sp. DSM 109963]NMN02076.1 5-formyltetrahydrofolate cyclo-ligase [Bifidobacterium sp. DSM 109963]